MKLNIRSKLLLGFLGLTVIMVGLGVFSLVQMSRLNAKAEFVGKSDLPAVVTIGDINTIVGQYRQNQLQHVLAAQADKAGYETEMQSQVASVTALFDGYEAVIADDEDRQLWKEAQSQWTLYLSTSSAFLQASQQGDEETAIGILNGEAKNIYVTDLGGALEDWTQYNQAFADADVLASEQIYATAQKLIIGLLVAAAFVSFGIGFFLARSITDPLAVCVQGLQLLAVGDANVTGIDRAQTAKFKTRGDEIAKLAISLGELIDYLKEMSDTSTRIAQGDLTVQVTPKGATDVFGSAFAEMVANLRGLVVEVAGNAQALGAASGQLASAANQSSQAANQIAATIQQVARGTAQQSESVTRTAASVEQMSRAIDGVAKGAQEQAGAVGRAADITSHITVAVQQVAANAQSGADGSGHAAQVAQGGAQTVAATIQGMEAIRNKVNLSAQKVQEMGQRSEQIGVIVETIDDIASQTNLLALNAAIEAARAGEHGKGFAVVADEVRKLAERASAATKEIGGLVRDIQRTVSDAVSAMNEGSAEVERGVDQANQAGDALEQILAAVKGVNTQVAEIASAAKQMNDLSNELVTATDSVSAVVEENTAATEEMSAGSTEVTQAIENIASVSEENSAAVEEVSAGAEELNAQVEEVTASAQSLAEMAEALQRVVAQFKLDAQRQEVGTSALGKAAQVSAHPLLPANSSGKVQPVRLLQ